jgi:hypothetical protein
MVIVWRISRQNVQQTDKDKCYLDSNCGGMKIQTDEILCISILPESVKHTVTVETQILSQVSCVSFISDSKK